MSIDSVKEYFAQFNKDKEVLELAESTATVELAANALGVIGAQIAKTLSFKFEDVCILLVTAGDTKIDNKKFKTAFGFKAKMPSYEEVLEWTGHPVGGVCPFALKNSDIKVYCDISMQRFNSVYPACGSANSAIKLTCNELFKFSKAICWVDACKDFC